MSNSIALQGFHTITHEIERFVSCVSFNHGLVICLFPFPAQPTQWSTDVPFFLDHGDSPCQALPRRPKHTHAKPDQSKPACARGASAPAVSCRICTEARGNIPCTRQQANFPSLLQPLSFSCNSCIPALSLVRNGGKTLHAWPVIDVRAAVRGVLSGTCSSDVRSLGRGR